ncbi:unnamed protein product [Caenorhabditis auriculariae]|uniref:Uncharacterized protein n=1 Tax=Caenorhabditis auriculariae TaxID=2777116 RepID=A0A8S1GM85_9PELO|nr:unnamed protein product [Caenorhabditis auriculariae]
MCAWRIIGAGEETYCIRTRRCDRNVCEIAANSQKLEAASAAIHAAEADDGKSMLQGEAALRFILLNRLFVIRLLG